MERYEATIIGDGDQWQAELFKVDEDGRSGDCLGTAWGQTPQAALYELATSRVAVEWED